MYIYRPYRNFKDLDPYPLKARMGVFKWPGGFYTKGPYRKPPLNLVTEVNHESIHRNTNPEL